MGYMRSTLYVSASTAILVVTFLSHGALGQRAQGVSGSDKVDCPSNLEKLDLKGSYILDQDTLKAVGGDVQIFINCIPSGSVVLVELKNIHVERTLIVDKPLHMLSRAVGGSELHCPPNKQKPVVLISSNDVVFESFIIQGCTLRSNKGAVHVESSSGVLLRDFKCDSNMNSKGPGCLSAVRSKLTLNNASVMDNIGTLGGALFVSNTSVAMLKQCKFQNNSVSGVGGAGYFGDSTLEVSDTEFLDNNAFSEDGLLWEGGQLPGATVANSTSISNIIHNKGKSGGGGALFLQKMEFVSIDRCRFMNNIGSGMGGALKLSYVRTVNIYDSKFTNNSALRAGAVYIKGTNESILSMGRTYFDGNTVPTSLQNEFFPLTGGGMLITGLSKSTVENTTFVRNVAQRGGGVFAEVNNENHLQISGCVFEKNTVTGLSGHTYGGGLAVHESHGGVTVSDTLFQENTAADIGGAFAGVNIKKLEVVDSNFLGNKAGRYAGATYVQGINGSKIEVHRSEFTDNTVDTSPKDKTRNQVGGALNWVNFSNATINDSIFQKNIAQKGGALYVQVSKARAVLKLERCQFYLNRAEGLPGQDHGGAVNVGGNMDMTIDRSHFHENTAANNGGAILLWKILNFRIVESKFDSNFAGHFGGGLHMEGNSMSTMSLSQVNFTSNRAGVHDDITSGMLKDPSYGGALYMRDVENSSINGNYFKANLAHGGGAIRALNVSSLSILSSHFEKNVAQMTSGGGLYFQGAFEVIGSPCAHRGSTPDCVVMTQLPAQELTLKNVSFFANHAKAGGGIFALHSVDLHIQDCFFELNHAKEKGGAVGIKNEVTKLPETTVAILNTTFMNNTCSDQNRQDTDWAPGPPVAGGGALSLEGNRIIVNMTTIDFVGNTAGQGGAMKIDYPGDVQLASCTFLRNSANVGGAVALHSVHGFLEFVDTTFSYNTADKGGALYFVRSTKPTTKDVNDEISNLDSYFKIIKIRLRHTNFHNNQACIGGGALDVSGLPVLCDPCLFDSNKVSSTEHKPMSHGGGLRIRLGAVVFMQNSLVSHSSAGIGGGAYIHNAVLISVNTQWAGNHAVDVGGAIAADYSAAFNTESSRVFELRYCRIEGNSAGWGGIVHLSILNPENQHTGACDVSADQGTPRYSTHTNQHALFNHTIFLQNTVVNTGSTIFSTEPSQVKICCPPSWECTRGLETSAATCVKDKSSQASNHVLPKSRVLGTAMKRMTIHQDIQEAHASGKELNPIRVELRDAFDASAAAKGILTVKTLAKGVELSGNPTSGISIYGTSLVKGLKLRALPGLYNLTFRVTPTDNNIETLEKNFEVVVRDCAVGEVTREGGMACDRCKEGSYSFDPGQSDCSPCPATKAECNGSVLFPRDGYWHSHSQSAVLFACLHKDACSYVGRMRRLKASVQERPKTIHRIRSLYPQCSEGYTGVLCGSCDQEFGRLRSLQCTRCRSRFFLLCMLVLALAILIGLSAIFVRSNSNYAARVLEGSAIHRTQNRVPSSQSSLTQDPQDPRTRAVAPAHALPLGPSQSDVQISLTSDIIKIFVNFLQATSTAASINIDWGEALLGVLSGMGMLSGVSDSVGFFSFTCGFKGENRVLLAAFVCTGLPVAVWLVFFLYGGINYFNGRYTWDQLKLHHLMSALTILHLTYIGIIERVIWAFNCVSVDPSLARIWVEDTGAACYSGLHLIFVTVVGIPVLLVVGLGFPLFLYVRLTRSRDRLYEEEVLACYGFFYKGYSSRSAYWEVTIYSRKALLAVNAALGYVFQVEEQIFFALIIFLISFAAQNHNQPFVDEKLNIMEAMSLTISSLVFLVGGLIHSKKEDDKWKGLLSVFLFTAVLAFVAYMVTELIIAGKIQLELWLQSNGKDTSQLGNWPMIVMATRIYLSRRGVKVHRKWVSMKQSVYRNLFTDMSPKDSTAS